MTTAAAIPLSESVELSDPAITSGGGGGGRGSGGPAGVLIRLASWLPGGFGGGAGGACASMIS